MTIDPGSRSRQKHRRLASTLFDPAPVGVDYAYAMGHPRVTIVGAIGVAVLGLIFLTGLANGRILVPGGILAAFVYFAIRPPRGLLVTDRGAAVVSRNPLTGRPYRVVTTASHAELAHLRAHAAGSSARIQIGSERLALSKREWNRFVDAVTVARATSSGEGPTGPAEPSQPSPS